MSLLHHSLTVLGFFGYTATLASLGVTACVVVTGTQGIGGGDTLTLTIAGDIDADLIMPVFGRARLRDPDGQVQFEGMLMEDPREAAAAGESITYILRGPWVYLAAIGYRQEIVIPLDAADPESELSTGFLPLVLLNQDAVSGEPVSIRSQIAGILDYAIGQGADIDYNLGALPDLVPPADQQRDLFCGDCVDRQMRWCPAISAWWDYPAFGGPLLRFSSPDSAGTAAMAVGEFTQFSKRGRYDLLIRQVRITFMGKFATLTAEGNKLRITLAEDVSTVSNGSPHRIETSLDLREFDEPPSGLADSLHAPFKSLVTEFTGTSISEEVSWGLRPGMRLSVTGLASGTITATAQQITRDIGTGSMTIQAGHPTHLGLDDLLALVRMTRQRGAPVMSESYQTGEALPDEAPGGNTVIKLRAAVETVDGGGLPIIAARTIQITGEMLPEVV